MHVSGFDSHSFSECKKLGLTALFLSHSNILKWKYDCAILPIVFNSGNKFCCFFTFKVNLLIVIFPEWILFIAFSIFRIYTNDGSDNNVVYVCLCVWVSEIGGKTDERSIFLSTLVNKWRIIVWFGQLPFEKFIHYSDSDLSSKPLLRKISIYDHLTWGLLIFPWLLGSSLTVWSLSKGCFLFLIWFCFGGVCFFFTCIILQNL